MAPEIPRFQHLEIPYPTEVTPDTLAKIVASYQEGRSLGASVAQLIIRESRNLILPDRISKKIITRTTIEGIMYALTTHGAYAYPAQSFLAAEEILRTGEPPEEIERGLFVSFLRDLPVLTVERNSKDLEKAFLSARVNWFIHTKNLGELLRKKTPLEFVDHYSRHIIQLLTTAKASDVYADAIEHGKQRFHQLYNAAQQLPPSP